MSCKSLVAENFGQKCVCWTFRVAASQIYHTLSHRDVQKNWNKFSISWGTNTLTHLLSKRSQFLYLAPKIKNKFTRTHSQIWKPSECFWNFYSNWNNIGAEKDSYLSMERSENKGGDEAVDYVLLLLFSLWGFLTSPAKKVKLKRKS